MFVAILQFELLVRGAESLKDKRRVVRSVKDGLHREHMVSVAEIAALDHHQLAVLGAALVANSESRARQVMDAIVEKLRALHTAELGEVSCDVIRGDQPPCSVEPEEELWSPDERRAGATTREDAA